MRFSGVLLSIILVLPLEAQQAPSRRDAELVAVADAEHAALLDEPGLIYSDPELLAYIYAVLERLIAHSAQPDEPWSVTIINRQSAEAFAKSGGHIYLTRGLFPILADEDELAAILAHEIVHVSARQLEFREARRPQHPERSALVEWLLPRATTDAERAEIAAFQEFVRAQEAAADRQAVNMLLAAGYDPLAMSDALDALGNWTSFAAAEQGLSYDVTVEHWRDDHPATARRVADTASLAAEIARSNPPPPRQRAAYLAMIDGLHFGLSKLSFAFSDPYFLIMPLGAVTEIPVEFDLIVGAHSAEAIAADGRRIVFDTATDPGGSLRDYVTGPWFQAQRAAYPDAKRRFRRANSMTETRPHLAYGELLIRQVDGSELLLAMNVIRAENKLVRVLFTYPLAQGTIAWTYGGDTGVETTDLVMLWPDMDTRRQMDGLRLRVHPLASGDQIGILMEGIDEIDNLITVFSALNGGISSDAELTELPLGTPLLITVFDPPLYR